MFGLTIEEASGPPVEVWPDCLLPLNVFISMGTQWCVGVNGPIGLNYCALPVVMDMMEIPAKSRAGVLEDIRTMEEVALSKMREK